jgi:hypothetical protein
MAELIVEAVAEARIEAVLEGSVVVLPIPETTMLAFVTCLGWTAELLGDDGGACWFGDDGGDCGPPPVSSLERRWKNQVLTLAG